MKPRDPWRLLADRARASQEARDEQMPRGFDTRVLAALRETRSEGLDGSLLALLRRMAGVGFAILLISIAANQRALLSSQEFAADLDDPAAALYLEEVS